MPKEKGKHGSTSVGGAPKPAPPSAGPGSPPKPKEVARKQGATVAASKAKTKAGKEAPKRPPPPSPKIAKPPILKSALKSSKPKAPPAPASPATSPPKVPKAKPKPTKKAVKRAAGLPNLISDITPRKSWKRLRPEVRGSVAAMIDHSIATVLSEADPKTQAPYLSNMFGTLKERIFRTLDGLRVPPERVVLDMYKKQKKMEDVVIADGDLVARMKRELDLERKALAAEQAKLEKLEAQKKALEKRSEKILQQKTHPILRVKGKTEAPAALPAATLAETNKELIVRSTDDEEFQKIKASLARHLAQAEQHSLAVVPLLEQLSTLKERLVEVLQPEL